MIALSIYYVTLNEAVRLPMSLKKACLVADEIIVVDSGSVDETGQIAKDFGARFIFHDWTSIGHQVSFAEKCCSNKWVLRLDADEVLSDGLVNEILEIKRNPDFDGYKLRIGDVFPGIQEPKRWAKHYKLIRLYNREMMQMSGRFGHDDVVFLKKGVKVRTLKNFLKHYSYIDISTTLRKVDFESDMQLKRAIYEGNFYSPWRMVGTMILNFIKYFLLGRKFLYGFWGLINTNNIGLLRFLKFAKFYEYQKLREHGYITLPVDSSGEIDTLGNRGKKD